MSWGLWYWRLKWKSRKIEDAYRYLFKRGVRDRYESLPIERVLQFNRVWCLLPLSLYCTHSKRTLDILNVQSKKSEEKNNLNRRSLLDFIFLLTKKWPSMVHHLDQTVNQKLFYECVNYYITDLRSLFTTTRWIILTKIVHLVLLCSG